MPFRSHRYSLGARLFLRTAEFLWQEGHTAHETRGEAWDETLKILEVYRTFGYLFGQLQSLTRQLQETTT